MASTRTITDQTTVFTPPASCSSSWTYEGSYYNSISGGLIMQNLLSGKNDDSCFPSGFSAYGRAPSAIQLYSPGACPSGYATPGAFNNAGTTTAICCPRNFAYYSTYSSINYFGSSSVLFQGCISTLTGSTSIYARSGNSDLQTTVVRGPLTMWGQPVVVQYQQKDLSLFATTTSSPTSTPTPSTSSPSSSNTASSNNDNTFHGSGFSNLSPGAKGGIGVVIAAGSILVLVALWLAVMWYRRKKRESAALVGSVTGPNKPSNNEVTEYYGGGNYQQQQFGRQEIAGNPVHRVNEMEGSTTATSTSGEDTASNWHYQQQRPYAPVELA